MNLNDKNKFIIQDLDLTHILVSPDSVESIKVEIDKEVSGFVYSSLTPVYILINTIVRKEYVPNYRIDIQSYL